MKYKVINEVVINDKVIAAGEIVELDDKELSSIPRNSSLELVETGVKKERKTKKEVKKDGNSI